MFSAKTEGLNVIKLKLWGLTRKNVKGWMAGSNSKELRGLGVKVWTKLQLLLTIGGLRVDFKEKEGLFSKRARPNQYVWISAVGFGSDGSDLIKARSNPGRPF